MTVPKRDAAAAFGRYSGLTGLLGLLPSKPILLVLTYHRIGNKNETPYDSQTFSCTAEELDDQVRYLKRHFHLARLDEAMEMVESRGRMRGTAVLLTFDDGYRDNYQSAFPILATHGVQGVFFLPTAFIGTNRLSWWDTAAYIVKRARKHQFRLGAPFDCEFDLDAAPAQKIAEQILNTYVLGPGAHSHSESLIAMLEEACDSPRPGGAERVYMNWEEAAAMLRGGMAVGSHSHNHEILARLPEGEQRNELAVSRRILEERLGIPVPAFSYPVGLPESFSPVTRSAVAQAGYRLAFSFYGGFNRFGAIDRCDIRRESVAGPKPARFRLQTTLAAVSGRYWL